MIVVVVTKIIGMDISLIIYKLFTNLFLKIIYKLFTIISFSTSGLVL